MLDLHLIRERPDFVKERLRTRGESYDEIIDKIIALDERRRKILAEAEELKHQRNLASKEIGKLLKEGKDATELREEMKKVSARIDEFDAQLREIENELRNLLLLLPNIPHESVPVCPKAKEP